MQKTIPGTRLSSLCVHQGATIKDAALRLNEVSSGIAFVVDEQMRLAGSVTDGDIRRAFLQGAGLDSPLKACMQRNFTVVHPATSRAQVLDLMRARSIEQIPIVDEAGRLVGLHVLREIVGSCERPNWSIVMAGGRGERLRPLTDEIPKPMLRVAGRPILEWIILHLVGCGMRTIFLSVNYRAEVIERHFGDGSNFGCKIQYLRESQALGSGGALSLLPEKPRDPMLVLNGDLMTQADIGAMLDWHATVGNCITVATRQYNHKVPYGCLELQGELIVGIVEKPVLVRPINAGIYVLSPDVVDMVPQGEYFPITDLVEEALTRSCRVASFQISEEWIDVGQINDLEAAQKGTAPSSCRV